MIVLRDLQSGDAGWVLEQHASHYTTVEEFDASFEALVARLLGEILETRDFALSRGWIAEESGNRLGCVFFARLNETTAKLRMLFVKRDARGQGVGTALLGAFEDHSRALGLSGVRIWTHAEHSDACALYRRSGYDCIDSRPVHSFGRDLCEQIWEKQL